MTHGFDTGFLVAFEVTSHPQHGAARARIQASYVAGDDFALAPQVLSESIHVVTDGKRFTSPLAIDTALLRARAWWTAAEVKQVFPTGIAVDTFLQWMGMYRLGRKRLLDTILAATYFSAGITSVMSTDSRDFEVFGVFQVVRP